MANQNIIQLILELLVIVKNSHRACTIIIIIIIALKFSISYISAESPTRNKQKIFICQQISSQLADAAIRRTQSTVVVVNNFI